MAQSHVRPGAGGCAQFLLAVVLAWLSCSAPAQTNVALQANGALATASSTYSAAYPAASVQNGDRRGLAWGAGGAWADSSPNVWPDWLQIDFNGAKTIVEIDVFSIQNNYAAPVEPTPTMTFTLYGLTAFQVQYWTGSAWADVPGGNITGNNLVWRRLTFAPITTSRIRVLVHAGLNGFSRIAELEAWTGSLTPYYIHTDHLNTPRTITNQAGTAVWKWENLDPFGVNAANENPSGLGNFTCNLRLPGQYFDKETNLHYNYFRDYDPSIGRYVQADPIGIVPSIFPEAVETLNMRAANAQNAVMHARVSRGLNHLYAYVANNPLTGVDPTGLLIPGQGDGGGSGWGPTTCPLIAQIPMGWWPPFMPAPTATVRVWYCIYNCNTSCPGTVDKIVTRIQYDAWPFIGCYPFINRPNGM